MTALPEVLFVCVHNAGRSQMAAAFLQSHAGDRVTVRSAGTEPAQNINPTVIEAMAEIGIDLRTIGAHPKKLTTDTVETSDVVIRVIPLEDRKVRRRHYPPSSFIPSLAPMPMP